MLLRHTIFNVTVHTRQIESIQIMPIHGDSESVIGVDPFFLQSRRVSGGESTMLVKLLINLVRERPAIYDPSDPLHRDRDAIAALWHDIATEMRCKGELNSFYLLISTVEVTCIVFGILHPYGSGVLTEK